MTFRNDADISGHSASTGGGGRGGMIAGGGIGSLVLVGIFLLLGGNPADIGSILGSPQQQEQQPAQQLEGCNTGADANNRAECRVAATQLSVDRIWSKVLPEQAGIEYRAPEHVVVFKDTTLSGCGMASAKTGPFYCPGDQKAYFDVSFFDMLEKFGGKNAPLAQEYIVAHEYGHHIQNLEGTLGLSNYNDPGQDSNAVKIELQADCYAGIWAHHADDGADALIEPITDQQVQDAMNTARAVGDDNIQKRSGGEVRPDLWTHGSSEQRMNAFLTGYREGTMKSCDTLGKKQYR
ncbi:KPN_02809 family neutral zinc metallopeptidase [Corynebacterium epidermidicanis]|uniref:Putative metalloprotease n=1 Tax=Corynebacterium epidermidicanis TaxID=1050174 RepID=A0A0G3GUR1_9CORY|nr:neutral zinc metallopeptidase [Corynebacterium epidermidicanis]AKK03258.1 putative metalloprotease [Corynebacterium epidermidicanis]